MGDWYQSGANYLNHVGSDAHSNNGSLTQDLSKADVVGNALGLPHFGDARSYAPQLPGIAQGGPPAGQPFRTNPDGSRTYANGQTYAPGPNGFTPIQNPNVAQQVGAGLNRAAGFYDQVPGYDAREQQAYGQEQGLADNLNRMAMGQGPTVAGTQLQTGLEAEQRGQMAQAAGAGGNNAALARMSAMGNTAQLQQQTQQQQAAARAAEQTNALNQLAGVTNGMQNQSMAMGGQKLTAAQGLNQLAMSGESEREKVQSGVDAANAKSSQDHKDGILNSFKSAIGSML